ncbi:hypothetical protein WMY93_017269 [Mugilogobius chulae]|uniref:Ig-like domain-containing protein n=1 Tax=Mugilogobius chulae TaxID=88201 RepID=A0AAW0NXZ4_9GOBI
MKRISPLLLCLVLLHLNNAVSSSDSQPSVDVHAVKTSFREVTVGQNVTLECSYKNDIRGKLYWYKQSLEKTLSVVSSYFYDIEFYNEFKNNRFKLDNKEGKNNLEITNVQISDAAVYHCVSCVAHQIQFLTMVHVIVKYLNTGLWINQTTSDTVKPGRSLNLSCEVHFGSCDGPHRVHWFKQSEASAAGVLYSSGGNGDQCESKTKNSPTNSCFYNLNMNNVSSEQTGTYYCAVAACGQVLFGNGTRLSVEAEPVAVLSVLTGAVIFTSSLLIGLTFLLCTKNSSAFSSKTKGFPKHVRYVAAEQVEEGSRIKNDDTWSECIYFSVELGSDCSINKLNVSCPPREDRINPVQLDRVQSEPGTKKLKRMTPLQMLPLFVLLHLDEAVKSSDSLPSVDIHAVKIGFREVTVGQNVTLECSYKNDIRGKLYWYKQSLEKTLSVVSTYFEALEFYNELNKSGHFKLDNKDGKNNLEITNAQLSDSAVYHCVSCVAHQIQFLATVHVIVKYLNPGLWINQTTSETVKPGLSLNLSCEVHFGSCDGPHRVHWFKQSEASAAGVLYTDGGSSDQCESKTKKSPTNSCVYNLNINNVSSEQTGTYYCAVAACGQVLFGDGTTISMAVTLEPIVYILSGALAFTTVLVFLLVLSLWFLLKKLKRQKKAPESEDNSPSSTIRNTENQAENLHYAALSVNSKRRQRNTDPVGCVYSSVR